MTIKNIQITEKILAEVETSKKRAERVSDYLGKVRPALEQVISDNDIFTGEATIEVDGDKQLITAILPTTVPTEDGNGTHLITITLMQGINVLVLRISAPIIKDGVVTHPYENRGLPSHQTHNLPTDWEVIGDSLRFSAKRLAESFTDQIIGISMGEGVAHRIFDKVVSEIS